MGDGRPDSAALVIFARAPLAGQVKTRLIPALGPEGAAELYRCFLLDTFSQVVTTEATVMVATAEAAHLATVRALAEEAGLRVEVVVQEGEDLGERMLNAFRLALQSHGRAVIVGSDAPDLPWERVREALRLAGERDLVLGPCTDGGFYLIGVQAVRPRLFAGVRWGGTAVLAETLTRAQQMHLAVALLDPWYDVDRPEDLERLRSHLAGLASAGRETPCPRTWEYLRESAI
jgi:hypothetical protein